MNPFGQPDTIIYMKRKTLRNSDTATVKEDVEPILPARHHHLDEEEHL